MRRSAPSPPLRVDDLWRPSIGPVAAPAALIPEPSFRNTLRLARLRARGVRVEGTPVVGAAVEIGAGVLLGDRSSVGDGSRIVGPVTIGEGAVLGERCRLIAKAGIVVGRRALLGDGVVITDFEADPADPDAPTRAQPLRSVPIEVGEGARIGHGACLLPGARVEPGAAVAPHTVLR